MGNDATTACSVCCTQRFTFGYSRFRYLYELGNLNSRNEFSKPEFSEPGLRS
jgi:hypothetical protein